MLEGNMQKQSAASMLVRSCCVPAFCDAHPNAVNASGPRAHAEVLPLHISFQLEKTVSSIAAARNQPLFEV